MKVITKNNLSVHVFDDSETVEVTPEFTKVGNPIYMIISDCKIDTCQYYENVSEPPSNWDVNKFFFDGTNWQLNPEYVEPPPPEPALDQPISEGTQTL